jgi:hypothetical protein
MHFKGGMFSRMDTSGPEHSVDNLHENGARIPGKHATASVRRRHVPPGKGLGAFARPNISLGTLILSEKPLFKVSSLVQHAECVQNVVAQSLCALDTEQQRRSLELSINFPQLHVFMGIVKTSGIPLGIDAREGGIFPTFSRFNHSCTANAVHSWNGKLGEESLYAVKTLDSLLLPNLQWIGRFGRL